MDVKKRMEDAAAYIQDRYGEPVTVADMAGKAYLSPSYFAMLFRVVTGYTAKNYLNRYRLYKAARDLLETRKQIVEIAFGSGFSSQQAFTKRFSQQYGLSPGQFRARRPALEPFPPPDLWKERVMTMELTDCFKDVKLIRKDAFYLVGIEVDIHYRAPEGTAPIQTAWNLWQKQGLGEKIPDQVAPGVTYGVTHSETEDDGGKYIVCTEVSTLDRLQPGLVARRFAACDFAVFRTTLEIIQSGAFWRAFYTRWLPDSGYALPDESLHSAYATFNKYPAIEVYGRDFTDENPVMQIYAPVVKA